MTYGSLNLRRIPASDRHSSWKRMFSALLILCVTIIASSHAFRFGIKQPSLARPKAAIVSFSNVNNNNEAAFAAFVESLEKDETAKNEFTSPPQEDAASAATWQTSLDMLLDPSTSSTKRQILLNDLLGANDQIRESVLEALRERKVRLFHFLIDLFTQLLIPKYEPTLILLSYQHHILYFPPPSMHTRLIPY